MPSTGEVTRILGELTRGDNAAFNRLYPLVYTELRRRAGAYMRGERKQQSLQATALVHEAYLQLVRDSDRTWANRAHFLAVAARVMRHILLDHARARRADKRGGEQDPLKLDEQLFVADQQQSDEVAALDEGLTRLAKLDPRQSRVVELRYFGGLSVEETAEVLHVSPKTVKRDWSMARAWLHGEVKKGV